MISVFNAWGPLLSQSNIHCLQHLHNWGMHISASLQKFDPDILPTKMGKFIVAIKHLVGGYRTLYVVNSIDPPMDNE